MGQLKLPENVEHILNKLSEGGYEAYVVGGCVRDSIMGATPNDWDICTSALPEETIKVFDGYKIIPTGLKHGTITVVLNEEQFEVTTYRIDGEYIDNRRPESIEFVGDLRLDLMRRDFTINALAYNHESGIVDLFGGLDDIANKVIRCVGSPHERFQEDALRMLRALRFATKLDFSIAANTRDAIYENANLLRNISAERITSEVTKILQHDLYGRDSILRELISLLTVVVPEFKNQSAEEISARLVDSIQILELRLALLFDFEQPALKDVLKRLKFSNYICNAVETMSQNGRFIKSIVEMFIFNETFDDKTISEHPSNKTDCLDQYDQYQYMANKLLSDTGYDLGILSLEYAIAHCLRDSVCEFKLLEIESKLGKYYNGKNPYRISDLVINGDDLIKIGFAGKEIGYVLNLLLDMILKDEIENEKDALTNIAKSIKGRVISF